MKPTQADCAAAVVEVAPQVVRHLRAYIRMQSSPHFTIPQYRVLAFLQRNTEATLSELDNSQGVSLPTMSKLVGSLVQRGLITREGHGQDRRKLKLQLTPEGAQSYGVVRESTRDFVAGRLERLDDAELQNVTRVMRVLQSLFEQKDPAVAK